MTQAVERFFGVREGRLDSVSARERTSLAEELELRLVAVGSKESPSYLLIDKGEGQTPEMFHDTFLSLNKSNKLRIPFVQGKFNAGGTGVLQFCGTKNYQLIASKRHPGALKWKPGRNCRTLGIHFDSKIAPWEGTTKFDVRISRAGRRHFDLRRESYLVLPGPERPNRPPQSYDQPLRYGTCVKLYNYRWRAKSTATTEARYELERYLHSPCLPFRVTETRGYRANYYSTTSQAYGRQSVLTKMPDLTLRKGFLPLAK